VVAVLLARGAALAGEIADTDPDQPINVTADSSPGWLPSLDQTRQVRRTVRDYLAAKDGGQYAQAYAVLADINKRQLPFQGYSDQLRKFNALAGAVKDRRITTVTWTKDPAQAPLPGVYAAVDIVSGFANVDRYCGFLVLYQTPSGGDFKVMREELSFLDNGMAKTIQQQHSQAEVDKLWARLSAKCPNYRAGTVAEAPEPLPEQPASTIGYPTVASAMQELRSRPGVVVSVRDRWTIIDDKAASTLWSFPPPSDPAYPAAVKRAVVKDGDGVSIRMNILCEASKPACDNLVLQFKKLNAALSESVRQGR